ncbi:MAG: anthranilate phosphoribosyltransferase [Planctomycetota bacterium]|nr:MAG: anthranilate phosphoribosyltransferase [Planctomycetota bacterium]
MIESILGRLAAGENLSVDEMAATIDSVVAGECSEGEMGVLLTALRAKGETAEEVAGATLALRRHMTPLRTTRTGLVDTCGTGGDASGTFNISTAAALVAAAAGVPVAKHGNRAVTSKTGSADALEALGVNVGASVAQVERCLDELGICFCFAPLMHPSMKRVAEVRKKLAVPTIFNLLGPLANPARAQFQVIGVGRSELRPLMAEALRLLDTKRAVVVHGEDGLDEVTLFGPTRVTEVEPGGTRQLTWTPSDFGLAPARLETLRVESPQESAKVIGDVLAGKAGPARDIVVLNAAAALWVAGRAETPRACAEKVSEAIDSGAARELLLRLGELSNRT